MAEGQQEVSQGREDDQNQKAKTVPPDRAGVVAGAGADIVAKYAADKQISITEVISNKQRKKQLYVANVRKNSETNKIEYQLRETEEETGQYYKNGKWFPEKEVRVA